MVNRLGLCPSTDYNLKIHHNSDNGLHNIHNYDVTFSNRERERASDYYTKSYPWYIRGHHRLYGVPSVSKIILYRSRQTVRGSVGVEIAVTYSVNSATSAELR